MFYRWLKCYNIEVFAVKIEIEAKIKVDSLDGIAAKLEYVRAELVSKQHHLDSYFVDAGRTLTRTDRGLRLRQLTVDGTTTVILTYKGPRENTKFKSRKEIEVSIDDFTEMATLLEALGFTRRLAFEKKRDLYHLADCEVCLDELPLLGSYIEIEGPSEDAIDDILSKLGLSGADHISQGYSMLMRDKIVEQGLDKQEILFADDNVSEEIS